MNSRRINLCNVSDLPKKLTFLHTYYCQYICTPSLDPKNVDILGIILKRFKRLYNNKNLIWGWDICEIWRKTLIVLILTQKMYFRDNCAIHEHIMEEQKCVLNWSIDRSRERERERERELKTIFASISSTEWHWQIFLYLHYYLI